MLLRMWPRFARSPATAEFVVALAVDLERAVGDRECLGVASLMPAQQADAAQDVALERRVVALAAQAQRGASARSASLKRLSSVTDHPAADRLRQPLGGATRRQQLRPARDQLLLPAAQCRASRTFAPAAAAHRRRDRAAPGRRADGSAIRARDRACPARRRTGSTRWRDPRRGGRGGSRAPLLRAPEMMREHVRLLVDELRIPALDGAAHRADAAPAAGAPSRLS